MFNNFEPASVFIEISGNPAFPVAALLAFIALAKCKHVHITPSRLETVTCSDTAQLARLVAPNQYEEVPLARPTGPTGTVPTPDEACRLTDQLYSLYGVNSNRIQFTNVDPGPMP